MPRDFLRSRAIRFAEVGAEQSMLRAHQVAQHVFVSLARRAEQVRPPQEEVAREVDRIVRIFAGHLQRAVLQFPGAVVAGAHARLRRVLGDLQRVGAQLWRRRQPSHALGTHIEIDHRARVAGGLRQRHETGANGWVAFWNRYEGGSHASG